MNKVKALLRPYLMGFFVLVCSLPANGFVRSLQAQAPTCGQEAADIFIMLDRTGSVSASERTLEAQAANSLINLLGTLNNGQRVAIGRFSGTNSTNAELVTPLTTVTPANIATLQGNVSTALNSQGGNTNIASAINVAQTELAANAVTSNKVIILISDGQANRPAGTAVADAVSAANTAKTAGTRIITVAFDASGSSDAAVGGRGLLAQLASQPSDDDTTGSVSDAERNAENGDGDDFFIAPTSEAINAVFSQISNTITCNDGDPCTADTCSEGNTCNYQRVEGCVACRADVNCDDDNPCTTDTCGNDSTCQNTVVDNGVSCEDGNLCTTGTTCQSGACGGGSEVTCEAIDNCHNAGSCNPQTGLCSAPAKENGSACGDSDACNGSEVCQEGQCQTGTPVATDDNNPCTVDYCGEDGLAHHDNVENGTLCNDDANACNGVNTCQNGACVATTSPVVCEASDDCHNAGSCDTNTGLCSNPAKENGTVCGDENACNGSEVCDDGECTSGTAVNCDDQNPCTLDSCGGSGECSHIDLTGTVEECPAPPVCGNGELEGDEQCDLGELNVNGGNCESDCTLPVCGNGIIDQGEECDQGPVIDQIEARIVSLDELVSCNNDCSLNRPAECGNGILEESEACDDANNIDGDGCSATCSIEEGQEPVCGNETLEAGEACDDGNNLNGDNCSATCTIEETNVTVPIDPAPAVGVAGAGDFLEGQGCALNAGASSANPMIYGLFALAFAAISLIRRKAE